MFMVAIVKYFRDLDFHNVRLLSMIIELSINITVTLIDTSTVYVKPNESTSKYNITDNIFKFAFQIHPIIIFKVLLPPPLQQQQQILTLPTTPSSSLLPPLPLLPPLLPLPPPLLLLL